MSEKKRISYWSWPVWVSVAVLALDHLTKWIVLHETELGWTQTVIPGFFNLVNVCNTGCAWGMLNQHTWLLGMLSLVACVALYFLYGKCYAGTAASALAFGLMEGGIVGNMLDRIFRKGVVDFLDFHLGTAHWPAFNVADSAICVSVAWMLVYSLFLEKQEKPCQNGTK